MCVRNTSKLVRKSDCAHTAAHLDCTVSHDDVNLSSIPPFCRVSSLHACRHLAAAGLSRTESMAGARQLVVLVSSKVATKRREHRQRCFLWYFVELSVDGVALSGRTQYCVNCAVMHRTNASSVSPPS
jgi:hypothetical protein